MQWNDPEDPRPNSWRDVLDLTMGGYRLIFGFLLFIAGVASLIALAVVSFSVNALVGFAYLGCGASAVLALWIRDRRRNPEAD